jgi:Tol biopolymer transport system component
MAVTEAYEVKGVSTMSKESAAKVERSVLGRRLRAALLVCALVCAASPPRGSAGASAAVEGEGGSIAFSAGNEIYVVAAGGGAARRVVTRVGLEENRQPAVSPDGTRIAFSSSREGNLGIYLVGIDGQGLQRLTSSSSGDSEPAWSPDGKKIAFVRGYDGTGRGYANQGACSAEIYVVDVPDGVRGGVVVGGEVSLTRGQGGTDPAWSPDGTRIAFSSPRARNYELYTMDPNGNDVTRLTYTASAEAEPAWSPDGGSIAYAALQLSVDNECGWMGTPVAPISLGPGVETPGIYVLNLSRDRHRRVSGNQAATDPTWSPDGLSVAFISIVSGDGQLYTASVATGLQAQLTFDPTPKSSPSWSR